MTLALLTALYALATPPTPNDAESAAVDRADAAARALGTTLKARVAEELGKGGPVGALAACNTQAAALSAGVAAQTGVTVGRSSLRLRSAANTPPVWVAEWLTLQGERPAAAATPLTTVVDGKARVIKPIAVEAPCLLCHGAPESLSPEVRAELARRYPADQATGYALGDLRGALWAEADITPPRVR